MTFLEARRLSFGAMLVVACLAFVPSAEAQLDTSGWETEIYGGILFADNPILGEGATYGVRFGYNGPARFGFQATLGYYDDRGTIDSRKVSYKYELWNIDLSALYQANPRDQAVFTLAFGLGWAASELSETAPWSVEKDTLTAHVGVGVKVRLSESTYLHFEGRGRWLEDFEDLDFEGTMAFGMGW